MGVAEEMVPFYKMPMYKMHIDIGLDSCNSTDEADEFS